MMGKLTKTKSPEKSGGITSSLSSKPHHVKTRLVKMWSRSLSAL